MDICKHILIAVPADDIWPLITELDQIIKWNQSIVSSVAVSDGPIQKGFRSRLVLKEGNREVEYQEEVLSYEYLKAVEIQMSGGSLGKNPMNVRYDLVSEGNGTSVTQRCTWKPSGLLLHLVAPIIAKSSAKSLEDNLVKLKKYAEAKVGESKDES